MKLLIAVLAAAAMLSAAEVKLGKPLTVKQPVAIAMILAHPDEYVGKTVQVKGKITEVCEMMGCWVDVVNADGAKIHVTVDEKEIAFPKDSVGKTVVTEGKLTKTELTKEQAIARAKEEAKDKGREFNPDSVKGGVTIYEIQGTGAVLSN